MIWQFIARKKCQRQLELIGLVKEEMYTVTEMAKQVKVSRRTILRYLKDLQQKGYVIKEREWHLNYQNKKSYSELYRMLLMTDPRFQLFRQFLWGQGSETVNYSKLKELNRQLIYLNLSADCKIGGLLGESGLIFLLQLRYLRDFYYFEEAEIFQQMEQYHQRSPMIPISKELFPDDKSLQAFIEKFELQYKFAPYFYFDYMRYHFQIFVDFYHCHKSYQTNLYHEVKQAGKIIGEVINWKNEVLENTFYVKLFDLFFGIHQGLPLTVFNLKWQKSVVSENYYHLSKEMKRQLPLLNNCRVDELALAVKNILFVSHYTALTTAPNLESSLLIQEKFQPFLLSD